MVGVAIGVGAAATVGSTIASTSASKKAAKSAETTAASNNALQQQIYQENEKTLAPFVSSGTSAGTAINALLGLSGDSTAQQNAFNNFRNSDGYQFRLDEGLKATQAALGAKGLTDSGAALKGITNYAQNAASSEFGNYFAALQGQQQTGLSAASAQAGVGQGYANAVSANNNTASTTTSNAALAGAGQISSGLSNITQLAALGSSYGSMNGFGGAGAYGGSLGGIY